MVFVLLNKSGRSIKRLKEESLKENLAVAYESEKGQKVYKKRKEKVELVFGHFKHNLKSRSFLLRGFDGVKAEMAVLSTVFNIRRMITLLGHKTLIRELALLTGATLKKAVFAVGNMKLIPKRYFFLYFLNSKQAF